VSKHWSEYQPGEQAHYRGRLLTVVGYEETDQGPRIILNDQGTHIHTSGGDPALGAADEAAYQANLQTLRRVLR
jgi:hypothetical protein